MSNPTGADDRATVVAFLAAVGGTGRTSTVANLSWLLASAGKRVLVVDWGSEPPRVPEFLEVFYVGEANPRPDEVVRHIRDVLSGGPNLTIEVKRFALAELGGHIDVLAPAQVNGGGRPRLEVVPVGPGKLSELRAALADSGYDYVLIDAPTGAVPATLTLVAVVAEVAALCFRPRPRAIMDAAALARQLLQVTPISLDIVPVTTMFDARFDPRARQSLATIRGAFADLQEFQVASVLLDPIVRIPYLSYEAFDPLLSILVEDPQQPDGLVREYGRLAEAVTEGAVTALRPASPLVRGRYRRAFRIDTADEADLIVVVYVAQDRMWADWARSALERGGAQAITLRAGVDLPPEVNPQQVVLITSPDLDEADELARLHERYPAADLVRSGLTVVIDAARAEPEERLVDGLPSISLEGCAEAEARARLLTHFGLIDPIGDVGGEDVRFPGSPTRIFRLPPRQPLFVGREDTIDALRDKLLEPGTHRAKATVTGVPGIGKSELALAYGYRFAGDYDLVWWLSAHDEQSLLLSLAQLARNMQEEELLDVQFAEYGTTTALAELASGNRVKRWLLIFDNADDLDLLRGRLPDGDVGHVLVTSNTAPDSTIELAELSTTDCRYLLDRHLPGLSIADASRIAAAVDQLPLALQLAGSWMVEAVNAERQGGTGSADAAVWAGRALLEQLAVQAESATSPVELMVPVIVESLERTNSGRLVVLLARMCSFLSAQGIDLDLVRSPAMLNQLITVGKFDADMLRVDSWDIDRLLWLGARYGLFRVHWGAAKSLRLHRVVQSVLRAAMPTAQHEELRGSVHAVLAAYAPTEVEEDAVDRRTRFAELQKHVFPSGAVGSDDDAVRRWLVNQVRFLYTDGGIGVSDATTAPAHDLLETWTNRYGPDDSLRNRLAAQLANIERRMGRPDVALRLDDTALREQLLAQAPVRPQALISARGRAADLRALGRFTEALTEDQTAWQGFTETFGPDHPHTRSAANNLAVSLSLAGYSEDALSLEQDNFERLTGLFGPTHARAIVALGRIGVYQRELGRYAEAGESLRLSLRRLRRESPGSDHQELALEWHLGITERLSDGPDSGAKDRIGAALRGFRELLGPQHPDTLACTLSSAISYRAMEETQTAVESTQLVLLGLADAVGLAQTHPFIGLARLCLGLCWYADGDLDAAEAEITESLATLRTSVGEVHPWTYAAQVARAKILAATERRDEAARLLERIAMECGEFLGLRHPTTATAADNAEVLREPESEFDRRWTDIDVDIPQT
ncbi:MAG TPA: FxSxx-COOH system tetratricopeptide repeat protein [Pseudonocardiaceae bacterium]|jgi:cellulose biosynthesis protein BcsQ|nr:FxSxx-COOH system tetratricopeptide repeat protein [Pseudonocardiaceae bacterium]